jgi:hypothetical protein
MMLETPLRQAAAVLLESAIRIAPPHAREWGEAMREELSYVEGRWAAVMWALGGASVMAKHALISLFFPGRRGQVITPHGGLFAKNVSLRKAVLVTAAAFILAALLFFAAPPFRQALQVSLTAWSELFQVTAQNGQPRLRALAKQAGSRRDPEGLVFAAARLSDARESARLAEEAVKLDPNLIWVYAVVAVRHPELEEIGEWVPKLERWDPKNALFHLITAEFIRIDRISKAAKLAGKDLPNEIANARARAKRRSGNRTSKPHKDLWNELDNDLAWQRAMGAAFASPKFDDYLDRLRALDTRVVRRYGFDDPYEVLSGYEADLTNFAFLDSLGFAKSVLQSGQDLEAKGDREGAVEKCWSVARFGQTIDSRGHTDCEHFLGLCLQAGAYKQLQRLCEKGGNANEAVLFAYLAGRFARLAARFEESLWGGGTLSFSGASGQGVSGGNGVVDGRLGLGGRWVFGEYVDRRNAAVLQISSLMMVFFSGFVVVAAAMLIAGSRGGGRSGVPPRARPVATIVALTSAMGLLLSSATIYLTYRPYWYIFQHAILNGDRSQARDLRDFLMAIRVLPGLELGSNLLMNLPTYFWTGVTLLGVIGLVLILLRHFLGSPRANKLQQNPRMP